MEKNDAAGTRVLVTGGTGFLGQYVSQEVERLGAKVLPIGRKLYDLRNETDALSVMLSARPDVVIHLAAKVGGIGANMAAPATFFRENMVMGLNMIHATAVAGAKLVMVGTVCSYPKFSPVPFKEADFWNGYPEDTNAPYGVAKKALFVMCRAYRQQHGLKYAYLVPANMYGPFDHFDEGASHVIPALIRRFTEAKEANLPEVVCWGTGKATRSFLFASDAAAAIAKACVVLDHDDIVNLPGGPETSMADLAALVARACGYRGRIKWDPSKPDGQPRRLVDGAKAKELLEWSPTVGLAEGLRATVDWYLTEGRTRK